MPQINPLLPHIYGRGSRKCSSKFPEVHQRLYVQLDPLGLGTEFCFGEMTMRWMAEGVEQDRPAAFISLFGAPLYHGAVHLRLRTAEVHHSFTHSVLIVRRNGKQHGNSSCLYAAVSFLSRPVLWNPSPLPWKHCTKLLFHTSHEIKNKFIEPEVYLKIRRLFML